MPPKHPLDNRDRWFRFVATAGGLGQAPIAPGSFGALLGVGMHLAAWSATDQPLLRVGFLTAGLLFVCWGHFAVTRWAMDYWRDKDPKNFVLDEVAGYLIVPILHPTGNVFLVAGAGFLLFRLFDIAKIPPARQIDRDWIGAWGILLDDIVSGVYAAIVLYGIDLFLVR